MPNPRPDRRCPCHSGRLYRRCCEAPHLGRPAPTPEALMRSRYSAYALGLVDYVLATTDPEGPRWVADRAAWEATVRTFAAGTRFTGLRILATSATDTEGEVTFTAILFASGEDVSFTERSRFTRGPAGWRYHSGERIPPGAPSGPTSSPPGPPRRPRG